MAPPYPMPADNKAAAIRWAFSGSGGSIAPPRCRLPSQGRDCQFQFDFLGVKVAPQSLSGDTS